MKRTGIRRLALRRETLRRLATDDLARVAGGRLTCCTYGYSGCRNPETDDCTGGGNDTVCDTAEG